MTECNSNLIFLGQIYETSVFFYNNPFNILMIKNEKIIIYVKKSCNFFILYLAIFKKTIKVSNCIPA